jgi:radical SAM superfamily enzyme YgiQ (UPF0313 family)
MPTKKHVAVIEAGQPDADSLASLFILLGYGGLSISSYLHHNGYEVKYFPMFASTKLDWNYILSADYLLISAMVHTAKLGYEIADAVRANGRGPVVIFGGPHPTCEPEDTLKHCDFVATNEGEETSVELLRILDGLSDKKIEDVHGLVYRGPDGRIVYTPRRAVMTEIDFRLEPSLIHHYPGIFGNLWRTGTLRFPFPVVQFSRGCPFSCTFCLGARQLGQKYRTREPQSVIEDLRKLHQLTGFPYGMFHDNDVAIRRNETKQLLRDMIANNVKLNRLSAFTRIDSTKDEELWHLFDAAGIANVFFGVESLNQDSLDNFQKKTTVGGIHEALERLDRYKVKAKIVASFVVGDTDDPLKEMALIREFWRRYYRRLQRVVVQPLMEYPFQQKLRNQHQLYPDEQFVHYDWDFYGGDYLVFYPTAVPASVFQEELRRTFHVLHSVPEEAKGDFDYQTTQALIRYTHRRKDRNIKHYVEFLKNIETGKYDGDGRLKRETLADDVKPWTVDLASPTRRKVRIPARPGAAPRWPSRWSSRWPWRPAAQPIARGALEVAAGRPAQIPGAIVDIG